MPKQPELDVTFTHEEARVLARLVDMWCHILDRAETGPHVCDGAAIVPPLESAAMKLAVALVGAREMI